jgi:hypothetical protein
MKDTDSAFPVVEATHGGADYDCSDPGMTLKQYAAIRLKVPRSGDPEIDGMIRESRRMDFAKMGFDGDMRYLEEEAYRAFKFADAMLAEWEKEAGNGGEV